MIGVDVFEHIDVPAEPVHFDSVDFAVLAQPEMSSQPVVALIAPTAVDFCKLSDVARDNFHVGANAISIRLDPFQLDEDPMVLGFGQVLKDRWPCAGIEDNYIDRSIIIEVGKCAATAALSRWQSVAALVGDGW